MPVLALPALLELVTQILKTFNLVQEGKPPEQVKAEWIIAFSLFKSIVGPFLPPDVVQKLKDAKVWD